MNAYRETFNELMKSVNICVAAHVVTFDKDTQRAQIRVGVEIVDRNGVTIDPPVIIDVPVLFPGGTQFMIIHRVDPGDEGFLIFSQKCLDAWKQTGGVARNPLARFNSLHDAFFVIGARPLPAKISSFSNNGIRLQSRNANYHVWIKNNGDIIADNKTSSAELKKNGTITLDNSAAQTIMSPNGAVNTTNGSGNITLGADGTVDINGVTFAPDGKMTSSTTMTVDDIIYRGNRSLADHVHGGIVPGGDDTDISK